MMQAVLPISLCLFTSTKGHWETTDLYKATLAHWERQLPLAAFGARYAHIKAGTTAQDTRAAEAMEAHLGALGFTVERTVADWQRGTVHQQEYLRDIRRASRAPTVQSQPYTLVLEDDSIVVSAVDNLTRCLGRMTRFLDNPEVVSARFLRAGDLSTSPVLKSCDDHFYSPDLNLQPLIVRSRDFYVANRLIETNWESISHLQCELVLRIAFNQLTPSPLCHVVWHPTYAHTVHLGVETWPTLLKDLHL